VLRASQHLVEDIYSIDDVGLPVLDQGPLPAVGIEDLDVEAKTELEDNDVLRMNIAMILVDEMNRLQPNDQRV